MRILVFGAGVLGCNLARDLFRAGKDVTLLARGSWAAEIQQNGLRIKDKFSPRMSVSRVPVVTELKPEDVYDVIFVVLRYLAYVLVCAYAVNGARGFTAGFWQMLVMLSVMNLIDRFLIDDYWVGHTKAWAIPGTEDLKPYITGKDRQKKWLFGTVGMVVIAAVLSAVMMLFVH